MDFDRDFEELFGQVVGHGAQATVYAKGDFAVKLYREGYPKEEVFTEAFNMAYLERAGFPGPKVYEILFINGRFGLRMDRVKGKPVASLMSEAKEDPDKLKEILSGLVDLQCYLHKHIDAGGWALDAKLRLRDLLTRSSKLTDTLRASLLRILDGLPDGRTLCHCDFHGDNLFFDGKEYMVIDLQAACKGNPAVDAACTYVSYCFADKALADLYLSLYCEKSGIPRDNIMEWLPVYAGALLEIVPARYTAVLEEFIARGGIQ